MDDDDFKLFIEIDIMIYIKVNKDFVNYFLFDISDVNSLII